MDFKSLVGVKVNCIAKVKRISYNDHLTHDFVLLEDVYCNGDFFRTHSFIKRSKILKHVKKDDVISFVAIVKEYIDGEDINKKKLGLSQIRSVEKVIIEEEL